LGRHRPDFGEARGKLFRGEFYGDGPAGLFKAGETPKIWEIPALLRLGRLHGAIVTLQKNAFAIWLFLQGQSLPVMAEAGETLDEIVFAETLADGEPGDFFVGQAHLSRPAAAGGATLTFVEDRHGDRIIRSFVFLKQYRSPPGSRSTAQGMILSLRYGPIAL